VGSEMDLTGSGSCPMAVSGICAMKLSGSDTRMLHM
jgi:hypothetical protein